MALRWPRLTGCAAAVVAAAGLLSAFDFVVQQGVTDGAKRLAHERDRSDATWRCNVRHSMQERADCLRAVP